MNPSNRASRQWPALTILAMAAMTLLPGSRLGAAPKMPDSIARQLQGIRDAGHDTYIRQLQTTAKTPRPSVNVLSIDHCADDGQAGSLRSVMMSALSGDTIDLTTAPCSTLPVTSGYIYTAADDLTIRGPGTAALTVSGNGSSPVFYHGGIGTMRIEDLSISEGHGENTWGSCVLAPSGSLELTRVRISNCVTRQTSMAHGSDVFGGGVMAFMGLHVIDSTISGNLVTSVLSDPGTYTNTVSGGGLFTLLGPLVIENSSLTGNSATSTQAIQGSTRGGGASILNGEVTVSDSVISGNTLHSAFIDSGNRPSASTGAGLHVDYSQQVNISGTTISDNGMTNEHVIADSNGGGVWMQAVNAHIENSAFTGNASAGTGGGVASAAGSARFINSTFSGNHSEGNGGGLFGIFDSVTDEVSIDNCTIALNISDDGTGGFYSKVTNTRLQSTIVAQNLHAGAPSDVGTQVGLSISGDHNLIIAAGTTSIPVDTVSLDPQLLPLANNGGTTKTHALFAGSPAVDHGSNPDALPFDQRGAGYARVNGTASDIGAFEFGSASDVVFFDGFES